jgi:hypothetical protein
MADPERTGNWATWTGFLVVAFAVVGLIGAFGTYAAALPFDRAMARSATLDRVIAAAHAPDPKTAEAALRPLLGESETVLSGDGPIEPRVDAERRRVFAEMHAEAAIYGFRFRCYIALFTVMAAVFGAMVMSFGRTQGPGAGRQPS